MDNQVILVTGGVGLVGISIIEHLKEQYANIHIHVLDLTGPTHENDPRYFPKVDYHVGNITDREFVQKVVRESKPCVVFHTAGLIPSVAQRLNMDAEKHYLAVNVEGTKNILEAARDVGSVRAFVYTSSADVVKGDSWMNLVNADESVPVPEVFDEAYPKSKVL